MRPFMAAGQVTLFEDPLDEQFRTFHHENPRVYERLVELAREWKRAGHAKCSIDMLFHLLRWDEGIRTRGDQFVLNSNYTSRYARLIMANEPDLDGLFNLRELHAR